MLNVAQLLFKLLWWTFLMINGGCLWRFLGSITTQFRRTHRWGRRPFVDNWCITSWDCNQYCRLRNVSVSDSAPRLHICKGGKVPRQKDFHNLMPFFWITLNGLNSQESVSSAHDGVTFCIGASVSTFEFDSNAMGYMLPADPTGEICFHVHGQHLYYKLFCAPWHLVQVSLVEAAHVHHVW